MVPQRREAKRSVLLEQQKINSVWSADKYFKILSRILYKPKQSHLLTFLGRTFCLAQPKQKICIHTGQCRIPQNRCNQRTLRRKEELDHDRTHPALLTRTQPNRNLLESHKKCCDKITAFQ